MNISQINELAKVLNENCLTAVEVKENGTTVRLERSCGAVPTPSVVPVAEQVASPAPVKNETVEESPRQPENFKEVKSPMVGVFYTSPAPDEEPYVKVGDKVKKGDVLCIIEAMKLMNEITSTCDGEIAEICVENGQVVEFSQVLFKLK